MAAGEAFVTSYLESYLKDLLSADLQIQTYAPGGVWEQKPPENKARPVIRLWKRTAGKDDFRQIGGGISRVQSNPEYVVCILDRQNANELDFVYGTVGSTLVPMQRSIELGSVRLYELLHQKQRTVGTFNYTSEVLREYTEPLDLSVAQVDVGVGWVVRFRVS